MATQPPSDSSFSPRQRWHIVLNVCLTSLAVLAVVVMVNYLSRDYFLHLRWSTQAKAQLSPLTVKFLQSLTNQVRVTLFYDKKDALYGTIANLLNEYHLANHRITIQAVDYLRDPGPAEKVRADYRLGPGAKNKIIFDCEGRGKLPLDGNELTRGAAELLRGEKEPVLIRRPTEFLGERAFTSALIAITTPKPLMAYFVEDDRGEHKTASGEDFGYRTFRTVLEQNYIQVQALSLLGTNEVPADCHLLVLAGPQAPLSPLELEKIDEYLSQGGRLLALFNASLIDKRSGLVPYCGLEAVLAKWGIEVGNTVILDPQNSPSREGFGMIVSGFSPNHALVNPLLGSGLYLIQPRKVGKLRTRPQTPDAARVEELAYTSSQSFTTGSATRRAAYPVMATVETTIRGVTTERGSTRMLVVGDSLFLANAYIDLAENRTFAGYAVNWLLDRAQLVEAIGPRPVGQYRIVMTNLQMQTTKWLLLSAMPGVVLFLGGLVWLRRRR